MEALILRLEWVREYFKHPAEWQNIRPEIERALDEAIAIAEALPELPSDWLLQDEITKKTELAQANDPANSSNIVNLKSE